MAKLWKKIDQAQSIPVKLNLEKDICFYAREYISRGDYASSECNQLVQNFKKSPDKIDTPQWKHKLHAIKKFASELEMAFANKSYTISFIPTSKKRGSKDYDDRFDRLISIICKSCPNLIYEEPIEIEDDCHSASKQGGSRDSKEIYKTYIWKGFHNIPEKLIVIDDVVTTGGHFLAYKKMILENCPDIEVIGLFWGMTIWPDVDVFDIIPADET